MSTIVGVMDRDSGRDQNTDINVVVDQKSRTLTWVPRDLWVDSLRSRINSVYRLGGDHSKYIAAMTGLGWPVDHAVILWPRFTASLLSKVDIDVPVAEGLFFWYPMLPWRPIEYGRKLVKFIPPSERLSGERVHQWCGARYWAGPPERAVGNDDLGRCRRQGVLIHRLLETGFDFRGAIGAGFGGDGVSVSSPLGLDDVAAVRADWEFRVFDRVRPARVGGNNVLVKT